MKDYKDYTDYMDSIVVTADLHEKIIGRVTKKPAPPVKIHTFQRYAAPMAIAAACVAVLGIAFLTIPQIFNVPDENAIVEPSENLRPGGETPFDESEPAVVTLTLEQAMSDAEFGAYVSANVPSLFSFVSSTKSTGQDGASLSVLWEEAADYSNGSINWKVFRSATDEHARIVHADEREKYDMTLYPFPWDESVPEEFMGCFKNPVFLSEELTPEMLRARTHRVDNNQLDAPGQLMDFSVLYGDVIVFVNATGASPEQLYEMLAELKTLQTSYRETDSETDGWVSASDN